MHLDYESILSLSVTINVQLLFISGHAEDVFYLAGMDSRRSLFSPGDSTFETGSGNTFAGFLRLGLKHSLILTWVLAPARLCLQEHPVLGSYLSLT